MRETSTPYLRWGSFPLLSLLALLLVALRRGSGGGDWGFFVAGSQLILGESAVVGYNGVTGEPRLSTRPGGLEFYANYPATQIGPVALLAARLLLTISPTHALLLSQLLLMLAAAGFLAWLLSARSPLALGGSRLSPQRRLLAACAALVGFSETSVRWAHLDDALALLLLALASVLLLRACRSRTLTPGRACLVALALALALGSKPWCLPLLLLPLLLAALPVRLLPPRRALLSCQVTTLVIAALVWAPFVLAAPSSLGAARGTVSIASDSTLALAGLSGPAPGWVRALQLLLALGVLGLLLLRARASASPSLLVGGALVVVVAVRIGTDPTTNSYFLAGLLLGAFLFDLLSDHPLPRASLLAGTLFILLLGWATYLAGLPTLVTLLRLVILTLLLGVVLLPPRRTRI